MRYHDGQCLELADGRAVLGELQLVFERDCVTVDGRLGIEADETDNPEGGGVYDLLIDAGPRWARTDEETVAAIGETVSEIVSRPSLLEELGVPVRS